MGRHKTISDADVLRIARGVFRAHGQGASTRSVAAAAGISEAVLYQRFGSKDDLFFAAMHPPAPDVAALLGPAEPAGDARAYVHGAVVRLGRHFAEVIPLALHLMLHPSFTRARLKRMQAGGPADLRQGFAARLAALARRREITLVSAPATARLLVGIAHDWALGSVLAGTTPRVGDLTDMVEIVWRGLAAGKDRGGR